MSGRVFILPLLADLMLDRLVGRQLKNFRLTYLTADRSVG